MNRQRRKRITGEFQLIPNRSQSHKQMMIEQSNDKITFLEDVNYKMQFKDNGTNTKMILLKNQEFNQSQKREAFKKKLRKYSSKIGNGGLQELE